MNKRLWAFLSTYHNSVLLLFGIPGMGHKEEAEVGLLKAYSFFIELKRN